jgi:serine/threonine protein kinase
MRPSSPPANTWVTPAVSIGDFCKTAVRSGLLSEDELRAAHQSLSAGQQNDAAALAEFLVKTGKLSRFQAKKLLEGRSRGLVLGPFQILSLIGRGGTGAVFLARDSRASRLIALKVLQPTRSEGRARARFLREVELNRHLSHPHLAQAYDAGHLQGVDYLAMEYIPGRSLHRLVSQEGPLSVARAARLFMEVASALYYAHTRGLIHRDMKPSNIMVTPHDHAKLLDLGLALVQGEVADRDVIGGQGYIVGTMDYISPEQTNNPIEVDARGDIYSLGCTLYFALTGQPPFPGGTRREKIRRQRRDEPTPLEKLRPTLPPAFVTLVRQMLLKDPNARPPTALAIVEALRPWAEGDVVQPLDRPDDPGYAEAIAALQTKEADDDSQFDDAVTVHPTPGGPPPLATANQRPFQGMTWQPWMVLAFVVAAIALGVLLPLLLVMGRGGP